MAELAGKGSRFFYSQNRTSLSLLAEFPQIIRKEEIKTTEQEAATSIHAASGDFLCAINNCLSKRKQRGDNKNGINKAL
jgi:hypothetical protein